MSEARRRILETIAHNKARRRAELPAHTVPRRAQLPLARRIELFESMARGSAASVERLDSLAELPTAVERYLGGSDTEPRPAVYLNNPELASLNWLALTGCRVSADEREGTAGIAHAFCGIAETGSLALRSEAAVSAAAWFLPGTLIVALAADSIDASQEDCWLRLRGRPEFPRALTFMTGPSRTGDIEQKIVIGAHGPKRLHIALYDRI